MFNWIRIALLEGLADAANERRVKIIEMARTKNIEPIRMSGVHYWADVSFDLHKEAEKIRIEQKFGIESYVIRT